jgi:NAD(P)-dependent dehydrogenase (short-subunit alcohol dehydrogenase family)
MDLNNNSLQTSVLITGASRGFGLMLTEVLAQSGHLVYATAREPEKSVRLNELKDKFKNLTLLKLDVTNDADIQKAKQLITEETGQLGVLINNAGYGLLAKIEDIHSDFLRQQLDTNVVGPVAMMNAFAPLLKQAFHGGLIINISSIASYIGLPAFGAYCASKMALNALSMSAACEMAKDGISVAVIQPGPYKTDFRESTVKITDDETYNKSRRFLFPTQEDPMEVVMKIDEIIEKKLKGKLPIYSEIPMGRNSNIFRILSRWLPLNQFVEAMVKYSG